MQVLCCSPSQFPDLPATLFKDIKECVFPCQRRIFYPSLFFFLFFLHLKLMVVRCLGWPAGGEVFMDFFYLPAPTPMPPLLSLLCLSHAAPDERTSCTNFIPPHRRRTYVGDLKETEQRESKKAFRVDFLSVVGLLLSSRGLHAFASSHQSI